MRRLRIWMSSIVACAALGVAASPAAAVQWNPQGTPASGFSGAKTIKFTGASVATIRCTLSGFIVASGAVASTTTSAGVAAGPTWTGCVYSFLPTLPTCVTSSSPWTFTAGSTTVVGESGVNFVSRTISSGTCAAPGTVVCTITATAVSLPGGAWSNTTHALTENSTVTFAVRKTGMCDGNPSTTLAGTLTFPTTVTIT